MYQQNKKAKAIMVVGTTSNSGKSFLSSALCRFYCQNGLKVVPYKAQNISLNSFATVDGGEVGRSQAVQAQAAGVPPHTDMNPVLLKPQANSSMQLIINGKVAGSLTTKNYNEYFDLMKSAAQKAYDRLAAEYDIIIMEGAGSPSEINILQYDFVNMAAAEYANAKVILVADIDKGGVFASIYGTIKLLPEYYQKLFAGIIINKFRGDSFSLKSGNEKIKELTGVPVIGVFPYLNDLKLPEEDTLALNNIFIQNKKLINIGIIKLPYISNFTDFEPLENHPAINVQYCTNKESLKNCDLIIIPGTKSTCHDMKFLNESRIGNEIISLNRNHSIPVIGICGGYQMLGKSISDPKKLESDIEEIKGLGLLDINTILSLNKEVSQIKGVTTENFPFSLGRKRIEFEGYEIHSGNTKILSANTPLLLTEKNGNKCKLYSGSKSEDNDVFGCYIHGLFDSEILLESIVEYLASNKKISIAKTKKYDIEDCFNQLSKIVSENINLSFLF